MVSEHLLLMLNVMALPTGRSRKRCRRWRVQEELRDVILFWIPCIGLLVGLHFGLYHGHGPCGPVAEGKKRKIQGGMGDRYSQGLRVELVRGVQPNT